MSESLTSSDFPTAPLVDYLKLGLPPSNLRSGLRHGAPNASQILEAAMTVLNYTLGVPPRHDPTAGIRRLGIVWRSLLRSRASGASLSGFMQTRVGAIGIALNSTVQVESLKFCINQAERNSWSSLRLAAELQAFGIPALPVRLGKPSPDVGASVADNATEKIARLLSLINASAGDTPLVSPALKPLRGRRIVCLGHLVASPVACQILQSLGTDVLWLNRNSQGSDSRKRSRAEFEMLVRSSVLTADLIISNLRPGAMLRLRKAVEEVDLIPRVEITGFSPTSPWSDWRVLGFQLDGAFGMGYVPSFKDNSRFIPDSGRPVFDVAIGILAAAAGTALLQAHSELDQYVTRLAMADVSRVLSQRSNSETLLRSAEQHVGEI